MTAVRPRAILGRSRTPSGRRTYRLTARVQVGLEVPGDLRAAIAAVPDVSGVRVRDDPASRACAESRPCRSTRQGVPHNDDLQTPSASAGSAPACRLLPRTIFFAAAGKHAAAQPRADPADRRCGRSLSVRSAGHRRRAASCHIRLPVRAHPCRSPTVRPGSTQAAPCWSDHRSRFPWRQRDPWRNRHVA